MHKARFALGLVVVLLAGAVARADAAPVLTLTLQPTKAFRFLWTRVPGSTHYRLFEDPTGSSGFTQVGGDITASANLFDHIVPLYRRVNARYVLQACNATGCIDSNTVTAQAPLTRAIGFFKASNPGANDNFGDCVALSDDGLTLAVGASMEDSAAGGVNGSQTDNSALNSGAVYVFVRNGSGAAWVQQAYIKASNASSANAGDNFGRQVALSSNGSTLAVGVPFEDGGMTGSGAVYVYVRAGSSWSHQAYIKASNRGQFDMFGSAVALAGDGRTLAVGAAFEDSSAVGVNGNQANNSANAAGAAYVFARSGSVWSQQAYIKASNTDANDHFGDMLSLSSDGSLLAVGASGEDSSATGSGGNEADNSAIDSGAVYVYERLAGSLWTQQAYLKASNTDLHDSFGSAVALSGNGLALAVGAWGESSSATGIDGDQTDESSPRSGAVYVFGRRDSLWTQQEYIKASNTSDFDTFGLAVALSNDGGTLAVGAYNEGSLAVGLNGNQANVSREGPGAAYVFGRNNGVWRQLSYVKASNTVPELEAVFGLALALSGNARTLAVGAVGENSNSAGINGPQFTQPLSGAGAVYVY